MNLENFWNRYPIGSWCLFELIVIGFRVLEGRECILINIEKFFLSRINDLVRNNKIPFFLANQKIFVYVWNSKIKDGRWITAVLFSQFSCTLLYLLVKRHNSLSEKSLSLYIRSLQSLSNFDTLFLVKIRGCTRLSWPAYLGRTVITFPVLDTKKNTTNVFKIQRFEFQTTLETTREEEDAFFFFFFFIKIISSRGIIIWGKLFR